MSRPATSGLELTSSPTNQENKQAIKPASMQSQEDKKPDAYEQEDESEQKWTCGIHEGSGIGL
jgi:hypothetical protein